MTRTLREISDAILWYEARSCWRFAYRDPFTLERKFAFCLPDKFRELGVPLPDAGVIRKPTKLAQDLCAKFRRAFLDGLRDARPDPGAPEAPSITAAIEEYFRLYTEQNPGYREQLQAIFAEFATTAGDKAIDEVRDVDLKAYEVRLTNRGLARTTVRSYIRQVGMLVNFAVKKGWIRQDPRLTYKLPKEELKDPNPFSDDELKRFFDFVRAPVRFRPAGWQAMEWAGVGLLALGLRPIELMGARWEHVNSDTRFLFVDQSHGNKVKQARQWQPIPLIAWPFFQERRQERGPIWIAHRGEPLTDKSLARMRRTLQRVLPEFTWKRFRKTYATILSAAGNDDMMVYRLLRHSAGGKNVSVAQRHYVGRIDNLLRAAVDEAFEPYGGILVPEETAAGTELRTVRSANATA
jgi:site-specific recombinase XerD